MVSAPERMLKTDACELVSDIIKFNSNDKLNDDDWQFLLDIDELECEHLTSSDEYRLRTLYNRIVK